MLSYSSKVWFESEWLATDTRYTNTSKPAKGELVVNLSLISTSENVFKFDFIIQFEVAAWLHNFNPLMDDRVQLLQYIMVGMISCNEKTSNQEKSEGL